VNWAAGITMVWMLVMTLGVPAIDHARSYRGMAMSLAEKIPIGYACVLSDDVGDAQRALLNRYLGFFFQRPEGPYKSVCKLRMVQTSPDRIPRRPQGGPRSGAAARPGDKTELFIVYEKQ
jgi:hypothetical protein